MALPAVPGFAGSQCGRGHAISLSVESGRKFRESSDPHQSSTTFIAITWNICYLHRTTGTKIFPITWKQMLNYSSTNCCPVTVSGLVPHGSGQRGGAGRGGAVYLLFCPAAAGQPGASAGTTITPGRSFSQTLSLLENLTGQKQREPGPLVVIARTLAGLSLHPPGLRSTQNILFGTTEKRCSNFSRVLPRVCSAEWSGYKMAGMQSEQSQLNHCLIKISNYP